MSYGRGAWRRFGRRGRLTLALPVGVVGVLLWVVVAGGTQPYETYEEAAGSDGPAAQFRFDDAAGSSTIADSAGSYTATNIGIGLGGEGPFGGSKSGSFGGEAYVSLPSSPLAGTDEFTAEGWVDWLGGSSYEQPIFNFGSSTTNYMYLTPAGGSEHELMFEIRTGASSDVQVTASKLASKQWEYVAVTETSSGTLTLYVNGEQVGQTTGATLFPSSLESVSDDYLGKSQVSSAPLFEGSMSNVAFYSKALSAVRIKAHYDAGEYPVNTVAPTISGTATDGDTLSAEAGTWSGLTPITYGYQWMRCNSTGMACANISSATETKYTPGHEDVGDTLRVAVTGSNGEGNSTATSAQTAVIAPLTPSNTALPAISGTAEQGQLLSVSTGTWSGTPPLSYTYKWEACDSSDKECETIAGATSSSYRIIGSQVGGTLRAVVTAENAGGSKNATSEATAVITTGPPIETEPSAISGDVEEGQTLSASTGSWAGTEPFSYAYQWERCNGSGGGCSDVSGATISTYNVGHEDVGHKLRVLLTATNAVGSNEAVSSASAFVAPASLTEFGYASEFGSEGSGDGQFKEPYGVAIGAGGDIFVLDDGNDRVEKFNEAAEYLGQFGEKGSGDGQLQAPDAVAVNSKGDVWVVNAGNERIEEFNENGEFLRTAGEGIIGYAEGIAIDRSGRIWVSVTYGGHLAVFGEDGEYLKDVSSKGSEPGQLGEPERLTVDTKGDVWVSDYRNARVEKFSESGKYLGEFGSRGGGAGELTAPYGMAVNAGHVFVSEGDRVQEFDEEGGFIAQLGVPGSEVGELGLPVGLAIDPAHDLLIADANNNRVELWGPEAQGATANLSPPSISGTPGVGSTLAASAGIWHGSPRRSYSYQWELCNEHGEECESIVGATSSVYSVVGTDLGDTIRVVVTATNSHGSASSTSATSEPIGSPPVNISPPTILGTAEEGRELTADLGTWEGASGYEVQWQRCNEYGEECSELGWGESYRVTAAEVGYTLRMIVYAWNSAGEVGATSAPTAVVTEFAPPVNLSAPTITGVAQDGETLTASDGEWEGMLPITYTYQWQDCDSLGEGCLDIPGATSSSYTLEASDVEMTVRVVVTGENADGSGSAASSVSAVVTAPPPSNTAAPYVSGLDADEQIVTANPGSWSGSLPLSYAYQWERCNATGGECEEIEGATNSTYTLQDGDVSGSVRVIVTADNVAGSASAVSAASGRIAPVAPANSSLPSISGSAVEGQTLSASPGEWSGAPAPSYTYQWERCDSGGEECSDIEGATSSTYRLGAVNVGNTLRVRVVATNAASSAIASSSATGPVESTGAVAPSNTESPSISGSHEDGQTLSVSSGAWAGTGPLSYGYQWQSCNEAGSDCEAIVGATSVKYTLGPTDEQTRVRVLVTASGPGGRAHAVSEASATIQAGAPSELEGPSISGSPSVGEPLYAEGGAWSGSEVQFSYQWELCDEVGGECQQIPGAVEAEYVPSGGDANKTLRLKLGASNAEGSVTALSPASSPVQPSSVLLNTAPPTISGQPVNGGTLTANPGGWLGGETAITYDAWERCGLYGAECESIMGASGVTTYSPIAADVGHTLRVHVNANIAEGSANEVSTVTPPIAATGAPLPEAVPSITGTGLVGETLTADAGSWSSGEAIEYSYQWVRCSEEGETCSPITGATQDSYTLGEEDAGFEVRVLVTASNLGGTSKATSTPIIASTKGIADVASPSVSGSEQLGRSLQASVGIWTGSGAIAFAYEWQRCDEAEEGCEAIPGATGSSYSSTEVDTGHTLRAKVTATGLEGPVSETSPATPPIGSEATIPENTAAPSIEGNLTKGDTLKANVGSWSGSEPITYTYHWQRCNLLGAACVEIVGATSSTYTLTEADVESTIRVQVHANNSAGSESVTSEASEEVGAIGAPANTQEPVTTGRPVEGQRLFAENGRWSGSKPLTYYYRWERCNTAGESCTTITGASQPSYTLVSDDVGDTVRVNVTAANGLGSAGSVSPHTDVVVSATQAGISAAREAIEGTDPSLLARSTSATIEEQSLTPAITDSGGDLSSQSTLASSKISKATPGEFSVETADGPLSFTPLKPSLSADTMPTIANSTAALFAEAWHESDTIVRPSALGAITLLQLRSEHAPMSESWEVGLGARQQLEHLSNGSIAIIEPTPEASLESPPGEEGSALGSSEAPAHEEGEGYSRHKGEEELDSSLAEESALDPLSAAPTISVTETSPKEHELHPQNTKEHYEHDKSAMSYAEEHTSDTALMVIEAPTVMDAAGHTVPAILTVEGDTITLTISPESETNYPITAELATAAPTDLVSIARDPVEYGLSDPKASVFEHLNSGLTKAPLNIKVARDVVPYYAWQTEPYKEELLTWLKAVGKHKNLKPYITLAAGGRSISYTEYKADMHELIEELMNGKEAEGIPAVKLWGAINEPDLPPSGLTADPEKAAILWKIAESVETELHCGCKIAAGEFHVYDSYIPRYISTIIHNNSYTPAKPHVWGFHDYYDPEQLQRHTEEHKGNVDLEKFLAAIKGPLSEARIWISETGVLLQNETKATNLKTSKSHARQQINAANDVLKLAQDHARVELVDYYLYEGPTKAYEDEKHKHHAFDSALVEGEGISEMQKPREAYCVLILNKHKGCSARGTTAVAMQANIRTSVATVTASVDPAGLPTTYTFEYGITTTDEQATEVKSLPNEFGEQTVTAALSGLRPCTTYHYEIEAENEANEEVPSLGGDQTFTTACSAYIEDQISEALEIGSTGIGIPFAWGNWPILRQDGITSSGSRGETLDMEEGYYKYRFEGICRGETGEGAMPAPVIAIEAWSSSAKEWVLIKYTFPGEGKNDLEGSFVLHYSTQVRIALIQSVFTEDEPVWIYEPGFVFAIEKE